MGGGTTDSTLDAITAQHFNPPAPWGAGLRIHFKRYVLNNFNPPAPWGAGLRIHFKRYVLNNFNPPAPWGAGLSISVCPAAAKLFQSTRPVGGGTSENLEFTANCKISIHPPRGGRDSNHAQNLLCTFLQLAQSRDCAGLAAGHDGRRSAVRTGQRVDFSVRTLRYFSDRFRFAPSDHQNALGLITCLDAKVLHLGLIMVSEVVKPQAVLLRIHQRT